jgi:hypothetical protein
MNDGPDPTPTPTPEPEGGRQSPNAEAARRRRQLREVEAERDQLRERLDATHRAVVEQQAADLFADPSDLWHATPIEELRGEDGLIDPEKAEQAMNQVLEQKPHWRKEPEEPEEERGFPEVHQGARQSPEEPTPSFGDQLKQSLRGRR